MKVACLVLFLGASFASTLTGAAQLGGSGQLSPISRVVELLQGLAKSAEEDGKKEETLFEKYVCWAKTIITTKTASNAAANKRVQELETYIADIDAGRIEFTTERTDLEKELEELNAGIEMATSMRQKENEQFLGAEDELVKATSALETAISVLKEATDGHTEGVLLAQQQEAASEGFARRTEEADLLARAAELGGRVLTSGDARFLQRLLTGEVPVHDWKKLNRKADFRSGYKARSFKIQDVLLKLNQTLSMNLEDARSKESEAAATFEKLMTSKKAEKSSAEEALGKLAAENGARALTKEEASDEVNALKEQVENDVKFIQQTDDSMKEKKEEWKDRSTLRAGEIAAISKAISILSNDDAKDMFKKSLTSQGYALLQVTSGRRSNIESILAAAASEISRAEARSHGSGRLASLAALVRSGKKSHFKEVLKAIDTMVETLHAEEDEDLAKKETCEKDLAQDTREASLKSRQIDDLTDDITRYQSEIEEIDAEIAETTATIKETKEQLAKAATQREAEHKEWQASDADDKEAASTVARAKEVLSQFYSENNLMLVQQPAGEAPPPPPTTWDAPYGGKTGEATSIIAVLEMIISDIKKDTADAKASEDKAQADFDIFEKESTAQIEDMNAAISALNGNKAEKETSIGDSKEAQRSSKSELDAVMEHIKSITPACNFISVNFETRLKNRQIEVAGLVKAKAILEGAAFPVTPNPTREIKPGDALFLQRRDRR